MPTSSEANQPTAEPDQDLDPGPDSDLDSTIDADIEPDVAADVQSDVNSDVDAEIDPDIVPGLDSDSDSDIDIDPDPGRDLDLDPDVDAASGTDREPESAPDHSWPASSAAGVIAAGPNLEIIPTGPQTDRVDTPVRLVDVDPPATVTARPVGWIRSLVTPSDETAVGRHGIEFATPAVWLWRRLVGLCFCYVALSFLWYIIKLPSGLVSDEALPTQVQVAEGFHELRRDGLAGSTLAAHFNATMVRFVVGLGFGSTVGLAVGLVGAASPLVRTIVDPVVSLLRVIPALAVGPLLILWFGAGRAGVFAAVAFAVAWTVATSVSRWRTGMYRLHDTTGLPPDGQPVPDRSKRGRDRAGPERPISMLTDGARAALLTAWTSTLAIETILADVGLGPMVWFAQGRADLVAAGLMIIGLTGLFMDAVLRLIEYLTVSNLSATE